MVNICLNQKLATKSCSFK